MKIICSLWILTFVVYEGIPFVEANNDQKNVFPATEEYLKKLNRWNDIQRHLNRMKTVLPPITSSKAPAFGNKNFRSPPITSFKAPDFGNTNFRSPPITSFKAPDFGNTNFRLPITTNFKAPSFGSTNTDSRNRRKSIKLIVKIIAGICGAVVAGMCWLCKKKSKPNQTDTEENFPDSLPKTNQTNPSPKLASPYEPIPLPYAPLSRPDPPEPGFLPLPQNVAAMSGPDYQKPVLLPLPLNYAKVIQKDKLHPTRISIVPSTISKDPKVRVTIFTVNPATPNFTK